MTDHVSEFVRIWNIWVSSPEEGLTKTNSLVCLGSLMPKLSDSDRFHLEDIMGHKQFISVQRSIRDMMGPGSVSTEPRMYV